MHFTKRYCTSKCQHQEKHPPSHTHPPHTHTLSCTLSPAVRSSPASVNMHSNNYRAGICSGCCSLD